MYEDLRNIWSKRIIRRQEIDSPYLLALISTDLRESVTKEPKNTFIYMNKAISDIEILTEMYICEMEGQKEE